MDFLLGGINVHNQLIFKDMKKLWYFFDEDELLTVEQQKIQNDQINMNVGFWIGILTVFMLIGLAKLLLILF